MTQTSSKRIVLIGAGSMVFAAGLMQDIVLSRHLAGSTVVLVDIDEAKLDLIAQLARRMIDQRKADIRLETSKERRDVLAGSDYVITTISVGGQEAWEHDIQIPLSHGVVQSIGDSVGPGGLSRALRHVPLVLDIAHDMEDFCPDAVLFNYSNPMGAICRAVARESRIQVVGLCHGVTNTRNYLADYLGVPSGELAVRVAGINHLVWMVKLLHRGQDAYPMLWDKLADVGPGERPAAFELMQIYGLFPGPGHDHIVEFYPHFLSAAANFGADYGVGLFPMEEMNQSREQRLERLRAQAEGRSAIELVSSGEDVMEIISALMMNEPNIVPVNVPNNGIVAGLPSYAIVEVSALVDGGGIQPIRVGELPRGILATLGARVEQQELVVDAALGGDRTIALQAMLADPLVRSVGSAQRMLDELLEAQIAYLPAFS